MAEEVKKPEEEVKPSETVETPDGGVEVSIEETKPVEQVEIKEEAGKVTPKPEKDPWKNKVYAQDRIITNLTKKIEDLTNLIQTNQGSALSQKQETQLDDLDKLAQTDWKSAVRKVAAMEFEEKRKQEQQQIALQSEAVKTQEELQRNVQSVVSRYPELDDQNSEQHQIFQSILDKNPTWRTNPLGPILTMHEMEDELRKKGYNINNNGNKETESQRLARVASTVLPFSKPVSSEKVVLSREEKEFCDNNGLSYADYARTRKIGGREGVSVQ